jgi:hypothetical protein
VPIPPGAEEHVTDTYRLFNGRWGGDVQRLRIEPWDVPYVREEARAWFAERGLTLFEWISTRHDVTEALIAAGARPAPTDPLHTVMLLDAEPPAVPDVETRLVTTQDDVLLSDRIAARAFGNEPVGEPHFPDPEREARYIALVDGEPAATGVVVFTQRGGVLIGGSTLPDFRGRGAYRALVRARWDAVVERGTPLLCIHAGAMSKPIAERAGFRVLCTMDALLDTV